METIGASRHGAVVGWSTTAPASRRCAASLVWLTVGSVLAAAALAGSWPATARADPPARQLARAAHAVAPVQVVATLLANQVVYSAPRGRRLGSVSRHRPITGESTVLPVLREQDLSSRMWLLVRLPGRPNGHTGWLKASGTRLGVIRWHIVVSLGARRAWIYFAGAVRRSYRVIVGKPSTPTPKGQFFVEENIAESASVPGGPYALALSARSNIFTEFDGGPGQIALHGLDNLGGTLGTAESHGCVRFANSAITWLAARIPPGTPVTIEG